MAQAQRRTGAGGLLEEVECREHAEEVSSSVDRSRLLSSPLPSGLSLLLRIFFFLVRVRGQMTAEAALAAARALPGFSGSKYCPMVRWSNVLH